MDIHKGVEEAQMMEWKTAKRSNSQGRTGVDTDSEAVGTTFISFCFTILCEIGIPIFLGGDWM